MRCRSQNFGRGLPTEEGFELTKMPAAPHRNSTPTVKQDLGLILVRFSRLLDTKLGAKTFRFLFKTPQGWDALGSEGHPGGMCKGDFLKIPLGMRLNTVTSTKRVKRAVGDHRNIDKNGGGR